MEGSEPHLQRVADAACAIQRDFAASGRQAPSETLLRRAADIVASYPEAWALYAAQPEDWDGRFAVAILWTWRQIRADLAAPRGAAA